MDRGVAENPRSRILLPAVAGTISIGGAFALASRGTGGLAFVLPLASGLLFLSVALIDLLRSRRSPGGGETGEDPASVALKEPGAPPAPETTREVPRPGRRRRRPDRRPAATSSRRRSEGLRRAP